MRSIFRVLVPFSIASKQDLRYDVFLKKSHCISMQVRVVRERETLFSLCIGHVFCLCSTKTKRKIIYHSFMCALCTKYQVNKWKRKPSNIFNFLVNRLKKLIFFRQWTVYIVQLCAVTYTCETYTFAHKWSSLSSRNQSGTIIRTIHAFRFIVVFKLFEHRYQEVFNA